MKEEIEMYRKIVLCLIFVGLVFLTACSKPINQLKSRLHSSEDGYTISCNLGNGSVSLKTPMIFSKDNELQLSTSGIDETKITYIYVANNKVFEQKMKNNELYSLDIEGISEAHRTDVKPKIQFIQFDNEKENGEVSTFKELHYFVKKESNHSN